MVKPRVEETDVGIVGSIVTRDYDRMQRRFRDRGLLETMAVIKSGISFGKALEVGPGPGYLGLEWLNKTDGTSLTGLELSPDMISLAEKNAAEYGLTGRVEYCLGNGREMPFEDGSFDAVFSAGSLHEWDRPQKVFDEMARVLKPGGTCFVGDLRRDINPLIKAFMWLILRPTAMRPGLITSLKAAYTKAELEEILSGTNLTKTLVKTDPFGLTVMGRAG